MTLDWSKIMAKDGNKEGIVELWGHEFTLTKNGLDEAQIVSFVNELINDRDHLLQRAEHLATLTKLAEKTVVEADKLAEEIKEEAAEQTKAETAAMIAQAEEQAQQMSEEKQAEIINTATEEAKIIKTNAEREAELLIERERERIQHELSDVTQQLYQELLSQLKNLKQQVTALEVEFEHKFSQTVEQASMITIEKEPPPAQGLATNKQASNITTSTNLEVSSELVEDKSAESQKLPQTIDQTTTSKMDKKSSLSDDSQAEFTYSDVVELEIMPPIDVKHIMGIMRYLDSLKEIENTELIPLTDRPSIIVSLHEPLHLIEILKTLPEVAEVKEVTDEEAAITNAEGRRKKIRITLAGDSALDESLEKLDSEIPHTLSS
jgi:hypothetical protein